MMNFDASLEALVAVEIAECKKTLDPIRLADCLASLCNAVGVAIAMAASGNPDDVKEGCQIAAGAIAKRATGATQVAQLLMAQPEPGAKLS